MLILRFNFPWDTFPTLKHHCKPCIWNGFWDSAHSIVASFFNPTEIWTQSSSIYCAMYLSASFRPKKHICFLVLIVLLSFLCWSKQPYPSTVWPLNYSNSFNLFQFSMWNTTIFNVEHNKIIPSNIAIIINWILPELFHIIQIFQSVLI